MRGILHAIGIGVISLSLACQPQVVERVVVVTATPAASPQTQATQAPRATATSTQPSAGSRNRPYPMATGGNTIASKTGQEWQMVVSNYVTDAYPAVKAKNRFVDPPKDGFRLISVDVAITYTKGGSENAISKITPFDFKLLTSSNQVLSSDISTTDYLSLELAPGGKGNGTLYWEIPTADSPVAMVWGLGFDGTGGAWYGIDG